MKLGHLSYLTYMLIFTGVPIVILWTFNFRFLKKNLKIILLNAFIALVYLQLPNIIAHLWDAWFFNQEKVLGIWIFNFPIEDLLYEILVAIAISSGVLTFIYFQKHGRGGGT